MVIGVLLVFLRVFNIEKFLFRGCRFAVLRIGVVVFFDVGEEFGLVFIDVFFCDLVYLEVFVRRGDVVWDYGVARDLEEGYGGERS